MLDIRRQRGFATIAIIGVAAIFLTGAIGTAAYMIRANGKDAGIKEATDEWKPQAEAATLRAKQLDGELTDSLESHKRTLAQIDKLRGMLKEVEDEWGKLKSQQAEQEKIVRAEIATFAERTKRQTAEIRRLREIAALPVTIREEELSEADAILRGTIRDILGLR